MKTQWSNKKKAIRNLIIAAKARGDVETVERLQKEFDNEI